jgi:hypothetical protein
MDHFGKTVSRDASETAKESHCLDILHPHTHALSVSLLS